MVVPGQRGCSRSHLTGACRAARDCGRYIDEYEALEETAEILSDPDAIAAIEAGLAEVSRDETITLEELRSELAERRNARWSLAGVVLARRARLELLSLDWPLIDAIENALGLLER